MKYLVFAFTMTMSGLFCEGDDLHPYMHFKWRPRKIENYHQIFKDAYDCKEEKILNFILKDVAYEIQDIWKIQLIFAYLYYRMDRFDDMYKAFNHLDRYIESHFNLRDQLEDLPFFELGHGD